MGDSDFDRFLKEGFARIDRDLSFLANCAGEVLSDLDQPELAQLFRGAPDSLPPGGSQAMSIFFQLLNLVEEVSSLHAQRQREETLGAASETGTWGRYLQEAKASGLAEDVLLDKLRTTTIEPVLTAHPTESKRWSVLEQHRELFTHCIRRDESNPTPREAADSQADIKASLERLWRTGEIFAEKPSVAMERTNVLYYLTEIFPRVLQRVDRRFLHAWSEAGYDPARLYEENAFPRLRFGCWIGGDRDGHPLVTPEVTADTLREYRRRAIEVLDRHLAEAERMLCLSRQIQQPGAAFDERLRELRRETGLQPDALRAEEPWREFIMHLRGKLPGHGKDPGIEFTHPLQLRADLLIAWDALCSLKARRLAEASIYPVIRLIDVFGFHLVALDIRQNSAYHDRAIAQLLRAAGIANGDRYEQWSEEQKLAFLDRELRQPRPFTLNPLDTGEEAKGAVGALQVVTEHLRTFGKDGLGSLIVSMTRSVSDLLNVYLLGRETGLVHAGGEDGGLSSALPVVPLLETLDDLKAGPVILQGFLEHPITRRSQQTGVPQVMIGYSDSCKDGGIVASQWHIHQAQEQLMDKAAKEGLPVLFFHGRGGTVSRGAGPTHRFLDALPPGSLRPGIRVTEQGEVIAQKFNNLRSASIHLELLLAGTVGTMALERTQELPADLADAMSRLSERSKDAYQGLLHEEGFVSFFRQATPIDVLEVSRIGSRPARRTGQAALEDLRAIPWVFGWNQSRHYLPGWFGVGIALETLRHSFPEAYQAFSHQWSQVPFARYIFYNIESSLASADAELMALYASLVEDREVRERISGIIREEYERSNREVARLVETPIAQRRPRFHKTLQARNDGLRLLHHEQVRLLRHWRAAPSDQRDPLLLRELLLSVNAIASGLRTTG